VAGKNISGLLFVGCLFIGGGIGLLLHRPDVGGAIGMGVGFFALALVRVKGEPIEISLPSKISGYFLILLGVFFIFGGASLLLDLAIFYPYLMGLFIIFLGLGFIFLGHRIVRK